MFNFSLSNLSLSDSDSLLLLGLALILVAGLCQLAHNRNAKKPKAKDPR